MNLFDLKDRVVLINGASRGIGEAMALTMGELGATVLCSSRRLDAVQAVADAVIAAGGKAKAYACHTGQVEQVDALFEAIRADFGRLDVLINNAATNPYFGPMIHAPESAFDKTFEVNVKGFFMMAQRAAQLMVDQGKGSIINVASIEGLSPSPMMGIYSMTKSAVIMMTKALAKELGGSNVRCNCICPGLTETKFAKVLIDTPEIYDHYIQRAPLARHAQPSEIVGAAVYFASDASSYTTGAILPVDGGTAA